MPAQFISGNSAAVIRQKPLEATVIFLLLLVINPSELC